MEPGLTAWTFNHVLVRVEWHLTLTVHCYLIRLEGFRPCQISESGVKVLGRLVLEFHILLQGMDFTLADNACSWLKMDLNMIRGHNLLSAMEGPATTACLLWPVKPFHLHGGILALDHDLLYLAYEWCVSVLFIQQQHIVSDSVQYPLVFEGLGLCFLARHSLVEQICG